MGNDITSIIEEKYNTLSTGKQKVANFILDNLNESSYLTLIQMQKKIGVSEATIIRFAYTIGFSGYSELQVAIRDSIFQNPQDVQATKGTFDSIEKDVQLIREGAEKIDRATLTKAVNLIHEANKIYIIGKNTSKATAEWFGYVLSTYRSNVIIVSQSNLNQYKLDMEKNDLLITISFPRYHRETFEFFNYAKSLNLKTISVTNNTLSPYYQPSDVAILAKTNRDVSGYNEIAPVISILNLIFSEYREEYNEEVQKRIQKLEELNDDSNNLIE